LSDLPTGTGSPNPDGIFICYRHKDSLWQAQMLAEALRARFGPGKVFMDVDRVKVGNWRNQIKGALAASAVFVVLIGPEWIDELNKRLSTKDEVRYEIIEAIRLGVQIVPVTLERTEVPERDALPDDIAELVDEEAYPLLGGRGWQPTVNILIDDLSEVLQLHNAVAAEDRAVADPTMQEIEESPAATNGKSSAQECYERGVARGGDDIAEKIADYSEAIRLDPGHASAYARRGACRSARGDRDGALADYNEAIRLDPASALAYNNRGLCRNDQGDRQGALADFNEAIRLDPSDAAPYVNRGKWHWVNGDLDGALADYNEAIRLDPKYAIAYNNRGISRKDQGDLDGALADYNEAIGLNPRYASAYINRGNFRSDVQSDLDGALADYNEAIRIDPTSAVAYNNRGLCRNNQGDLDGAVADLEEALRLNPRQPGAVQALASIRSSRLSRS
jgi:tetratricopeptide (TPR) repeat protein